MIEHIGFRLLRGPVQQLRDVAAVDDDFGVRSDVLLKFGDLLVAMPTIVFFHSASTWDPPGPKVSTLAVMWTSVSVASTAAAISAARDKVCRLCGVQIHRAENAADRELAAASRLRLVAIGDERLSRPGTGFRAGLLR